MQIDIDLSLGKQSPVAPFSVDEGPFYVPPGPPEHVEGPLSKGPRVPPGPSEHVEGPRLLVKSIYS